MRPGPLLTRRGFALGIASCGVSRGATADLKKIEDIVIYKDDSFYSSFPSIVRRPTGELLTAFRRAPNRRLVGVRAVTHTDPNSYCVLVRSGDGGKSWSASPDLIYAHAWGGSQDPCMVQLRDGSLVCTSYLWTWLDREGGAKTQGTAELNHYVFQGGYIVRSTDGGKTWNGPFYPAPVPGRGGRDALGKPLPAYNRGALCQGSDGRLYWVVACGVDGGDRTDVHLMISADGGITWTYSCPVASHPSASFNETSLYETPKGDLVAFIRSERFDDHAIVARSRDGGKTFQPWQDANWQGHPHHAVRLESQQVLLVYGYRHKPFGIRARILDAECTNFADAREFVLRDDGGNGDLGYPWAVTLPDRRALVTYYMNQNDGTRYIGGTFVSY